MQHLSTLQRLLWKEYRQLVNFWLVLVLAEPAIQGVVWAVCGLTGMNRDEQIVRISFGLFGICIPFLYLCGGAAISFAGEAENHTKQLLEMLPIRPTLLFVAKTVCLLMSAIILTFVVWCWNFLVIGQALGPFFDLVSWTIALVVVIDALACSVFVSLLSSSAVMATILSVAAFVLSVLLFPLLATMFETRESASRWIWLWIWFLHLGLLISIDMILGVRWLHKRALFPRFVRGYRHTLTVTSVDSTTTEANRQPEPLPHKPIPEPSSENVHPFFRLLWQQARQSAWLVVAICITGILHYYAVFAWIGLFPGANRGTSPLAFQAAVLVASLAGVCAFASGNRGQSDRFFATYSVSPYLVWLSRHLPWSAVTLAWTTIAIVLVNDQRYAIFNFAIVLVCYSAAQLGAFYCRSSVVGLAVGLAMASVAGWWTLTTFNKNVPLILTAFPLIVAFLATTAWCSRDRMLERNSWTVRLRGLWPSASAVAFAIFAAACHGVLYV